MEPFDPPESYSAHYYRSGTPGECKPGFSWKKFFHGLLLGALVAAVLLLLYVNHYQAETIQLQKRLVIDMWNYIQAGCPTTTLN